MVDVDVLGDELNVVDADVDAKSRLTVPVEVPGPEIPSVPEVPRPTSLSRSQ